MYKLQLTNVCLMSHDKVIITRVIDKPVRAQVVVQAEKCLILFTRTTFTKLYAYHAFNQCFTLFEGQLDFPHRVLEPVSGLLNSCKLAFSQERIFSPNRVKVYGDGGMFDGE